MSKELIKLNQTEQFLANQNVTMTLKEIADRYGKENYNLVRDFNKMISTLDEDRLAALNFQGSSYIGKDNTRRPTIVLDLKTLVWFVSKFDHKIRLDIVNYVFGKLEKEKEEEIKKIKAMAEKYRIYDDGSTSINGLIQHYGFEEDYDTIKNALIWKGVIDVVPKITIKTSYNDTFSNIVWTSHAIKKSSSGSPVQGYTLLEKPTRHIVDQYIKAGCPDVNVDLKKKFTEAMEVYITKKLK